MVELISLAIFACVTMVAALLLYPMLSKHYQVRDRIARLIPTQEEEPTLIPKQKKWQRGLAEMGGKLRVRPAEMRVYRQDVASAGFKKEAVSVFLGAKMVLALSLPGCYLLLIAIPRDAVATKATFLAAVICAITGYLLPTWWLAHQASERKTEIFHALPDILDLLTVCVEAGLSLEAALQKTTENFENQECPLIKELNTLLLEVRAGKVRSEALKGLAERTRVDDVQSLVSMLIQSERFGTSMGKTLRTYSDSLRIRRKQLAEERAAKTGVKMLFPLTVFIFPALLVVLLVPALVQIFAMFKK